MLTRSRQELTLAWAGQSYFNIGGSAVLGRAHIGVLILDESMLKCADLRYLHSPPMLKALLFTLKNLDLRK